ncbi:ROK family protein [Fodinicola feengrottensis]|uniref:ROK family protein n=1 Tax=Fodinicola feengrottensis TaxID=435914 RepID=UPI002442F00D|nr:ROK family protein [Fodinicola feengrottensis]
MARVTRRQLAGLSELAHLVASGAAVRRAELAAENRTLPGRGGAASGCADRARAAGLVESNPAPTPRGRPPKALRLATDTGVVCAVDLGARHCRLAVAGLGGEVLAETAVALDIGIGPRRVLTRVYDLIRGLLKRAGRPVEQVLAVSIGVPGPVEAATGTVVRPPIMAGWDGCRVPEFFAGRLSAKVLVDNDVNLMALGEYAHRRDDSYLLFVKVGTGIGCGIVTGGTVHRGAAGAAGDIGHLRLAGHDDVLCHCGNTGCLEAVASGAAIAGTLRAAGLTASGAEDVVRLVTEGNPLARRQVRLAGQRIGEALGQLSASTTRIGSLSAAAFRSCTRICSPTFGARSTPARCRLPPVR